MMTAVLCGTDIIEQERIEREASATEQTSEEPTAAKEESKQE